MRQRVLDVANTQRPNAPLVNTDEKLHRRQIAERANISLPYDGSRAMTQPLILSTYTVSTLPTASLWSGGLIYVSNETGGAIPAFSDGTNWRRFSDRAIVS